MKKLVLVAVLLLGFSIVAVAQEYPKVEVFGGYSYFRMDTTTNFGAPSGEAALNMNGFDINAAINGNKWLGFVVDFSGAYGTLDTSWEWGAPSGTLASWADISNYSIMVGPRVTLHRGKVTPFLQALIGNSHGKYSELGADFTADNLAMAFGGGLDISVSDRFAIRPAQVEYYTIRNGQTGNYSGDFRYSAGFVLRFGGEKKVVPVPTPTPAPPPPPPPPPPDTDKDGVIDSKDACPNTPEGVKVDSVGCPLDADGDGVPDYLDKCPNTPKGVKVNSSGCPLDTDGDGVPDYLDKCPDTPSGVKVNSSGCPLDTDGDGVPDYLDKCPDTARDLKVTADGCPILIKKSVTKDLQIQFDFNKADVKPEYANNLKETADFMNKYPQTTTVIEGHTDSVGKAKYNQTLSQKRADSVRDYLIKNFNISPDRLSTKGYGEEKPIASNDTEEGRGQNRRIQATFNAQSEYYEKK
jgi:outer membrane protein OmpA-like peptidoglycan-associated protein/opacity protein-like surface antigen